MQPEPTRIIRMASAFYESSVLFAACDAQLFGRLARSGSADAPTLARDLGWNPRGAELLLNACAALGLLEKQDGRYRNAPEAARFLVPGSPDDLSGAIRYNRDVYPLWGRLGEMARTGRPVEAPRVHLGGDPERTRAFVMAMHYRALGLGRAVVPLLRLEKSRRLLDVGGGPGTYAMLLAQAHPQLECVVLDLPEVTAIAGELIQAAGLSKRVVTIPGDYHQALFPHGVDTVLFFGMLHQEARPVIAGLLRKAWAALQPGGGVYVMDMMTNASGTQPAFSALFALNMALTTDNGWVFADSDLAAWLQEAGFEDIRIRPLPPPMPHWLGYARKPTEAPQPTGA